MTAPRHPRRCDCLSCFAFRLATGMFLTGLALILLLCGLLRDDQPKPLLINAAAPRAPSDAPASKVVTPDPIARAKFPKSDPQIIDKLAFINRTVNALIEPEPDLEHYGVEERWVASPGDLKGDCEDYALTKIEVMGNLDWPLVGNVRIESVVLPDADGHALVIYRLPSGEVAILDNNFDEPMTRRELVAAGYRFFDWRTR